MLNRLLLIMCALCVLSVFSFSLAQTVEVETPEAISAGTIPPSTGYLSALYKKALAREKIRAYDDALFAYSVILTSTQATINSKSVGNETIERVLPYAIAAAYRRGIATHRSIEGSVVKLYKQLQMYEDAEKWINEILTQISNLEVDKGIKIPEKQYGILYYARAYNKAGWAYAMFNGSLWKRYVIYMPPDCIALLDKSIEDLKQVLSIYETSLSEDLFGYTYSTLDLCYDAEGPKVLKQMMMRQLTRNVKGTIDLYNSDAISSALNAGRKIYTFEELTKPETKGVIQAMAAVLDEIGK